MLLVNGIRDPKLYRVYLSLMEYGLCIAVTLAMVHHWPYAE
jgi:hypothetical protein